MAILLPGPACGVYRGRAPYGAEPRPLRRRRAHLDKSNVAAYSGPHPFGVRQGSSFGRFRRLIRSTTCHNYGVWRAPSAMCAGLSGRTPVRSLNRTHVEFLRWVKTSS